MKRPTRIVLLSCVLGAAGLGGCAHGDSAVNKKNTFEARRQIARELVARAEWQPAFGYVSELHQEQPKDAEVLVLRATIYRERGLLEEADVDLREAVGLAPELASARAGLGILREMQRRPAEAEQEHRMAVKLESSNVAYLNNLGFSLFLHGKVKEAITYYEQAARLAPTMHRTRTNLGFAYAAKGDLHRAAREFEMGGTPAEAKNNLGFAYERRGDLANAFEMYAEAARLDPKSQRARVNLAHAAALTGRPAPAPPTAGDTLPTAAPAPAVELNAIPGPATMTIESRPVPPTLSAEPSPEASTPTSISTSSSPTVTSEPTP